MTTAQTEAGCCESPPLGECLRVHALLAARRAVARLHSPLSADNLGQFLLDSACLRYPTTLEFDSEGLESNQFAQPFLEERDGVRCCVLRVHPRYESNAEAIPYFVAYMAAAINYGPLASPDLCEEYGASLMGLETDVFYTTLLGWVDG